MAYRIYLKAREESKFSKFIFRETGESVTYRDIHHDDIEEPTNDPCERRVERALQSRNILQRGCITSERNDRKSRGTSSQPLEETIDHLLGCWERLVYRNSDVYKWCRKSGNGRAFGRYDTHSVQGNISIQQCWRKLATKAE